ncbi:hypothetical protein ACNSOL_11980 (plasmid) [Aliarcobacter lanthieri]|uniref:hypothetical protein n=1 Tax=Aliarcobacter lanthieri TaxID=1355374 RepID=UPI003AAD6DCF
MKKLKNNNIILNIFLVILFTGNLIAKDIELKKDFYELEIEANKMIVIDFPFKITDHRFLGDETSISGDKRDKSLYFKLSEGTVDVSIWGGDKPVLITLKAKEGGERRISFYSNSNEIETLQKELKEWNHDIKIAEQIEIYSKTNNLSGFEKQEIGLEYNINNELLVFKIERLINSKKYAFEKAIITNLTERVIDLFEQKTFYFTSKDDYIIDAVSFDDRYLLPGQKTFYYLGLEKR